MYRHLDAPHYPLPLPLTAAARRERERRVAVLADLIRSGEYRVPAVAVAEEMLRSVRAATDSPAEDPGS